jgi:hypothetical protein
MARKPDIQYVRYYTDGSTARQLEIYSPQKNKTSVPRRRKQKGYVIYVDPLAVGGILVSAVMLVMMLVSTIELVVARQELSDAQAYVTTLSQSNEQLRQTYDASYDLEEVEKSALALGMIPASQATTIYVDVEEDVVVAEEPTFWDRMTAKLSELFA